jgi:hypothetical protein
MSVDGVYKSVHNDAEFGGDARDRTERTQQPLRRASRGFPPPPATGRGSAELFDGLSAAQRYELDTHGFLHLKNVLSPAELSAAQVTFSRTV